MKTVVVLYREDDWHKKTPFKDIALRKTYEKLYEIAKKQGIRLFRADIHWIKKNIVTKAWRFENKKWKKFENFKADVLFDKCETTPETIKLKKQLNKYYTILNHPKISLIGSDKFIQYKLFKKFCAFSVLVKSKKEFLKNLSKIKTSKFVVKPLTLSGGAGIKILDKTKAKSVKIKGKMLLQEFIDSSKGIPKIVKGVHDLRIVVLNGKIDHIFIRTPKKGSLLCNVSKGGTQKHVQNSKLPLVIKKIVKQIDNKFVKFKKRLYSIDFAFDEKGIPKLIELNSRVGLIGYKNKGYTSKHYAKNFHSLYLGRVAKLLKSA